jgi:hypothetical protein
MVKPSRALRLPRLRVALRVALVVFVVGGLGFYAWFRFWFARPISVPTQSDRVQAMRRASDYLRAWSHHDTEAMIAMMSPSSLFRKGRFPEFDGGSVSLTGELGRTSRPLAHILAMVFTAPNKDRWRQWERGRIAFVVYKHGASKYFLIMVRDDGPWMVLNGPGCDLDALLQHAQKPRAGAKSE